MRISPEASYINRIDRPNYTPERTGKGMPAEELTLDFFGQIPGMERSRFSTTSEDHGLDIGGKELDIVAYRDQKPTLGIQVTTAIEKGQIAKKLKTIADHPYVRLDEMKPQDHGIPRVLIYLDAGEVDKFMKEKDFDKHPELALKIIGDVIKSLTFHLAKTKSAQEQQSLMELIDLFEQQKKRFIH